MRLIKPSVEIINYTPNMEATIEEAIRKCYKSEDKICEGSANKIISNIMDRHHESTIEHALITVCFICDRGVTHEGVRHRLSSFSQESTRYCGYDKGKFGNEISVIDIRGGFPNMGARFDVWLEAMEAAEGYYMKMKEMGATSEEARSVLPNSLKTELVWSANPRSWRHIFQMRVENSAHPQIAEVMVPLLEEFSSKWPVLFKDIVVGSKHRRFLKDPQTHI